VVNVGVYGVKGSWIGNQTVPVTGGPGERHTYTTWQVPTVIYLPAGAQNLTMWAAGGWYNLRKMTFTLEHVLVDNARPRSWPLRPSVSCPGRKETDMLPRASPARRIDCPRRHAGVRVGGRDIASSISCADTLTGAIPCCTF
jgi:hypothetical protein